MTMATLRISYIVFVPLQHLWQLAELSLVCASPVELEQPASVMGRDEQRLSNLIDKVNLPPTPPWSPHGHDRLDTGKTTWKT
mmetsp:Transcript_9424/g.26255  ORF Transcript_9424/g.26255 Transcript_9424/m.26255 type:complete len:82 (+) Transcript_9424:272-517(+)